MRLLIVKTTFLGDATTACASSAMGRLFRDGAKADSALVDAPYDAVVPTGLPGGDGMLGCAGAAAS
jgi:hypothetical protein